MAEGLALPVQEKTSRVMDDDSTSRALVLGHGIKVVPIDRTFVQVHMRVKDCYVKDCDLNGLPPSPT